LFALAAGQRDGSKQQKHNGAPHRFLPQFASPVKLAPIGTQCDWHIVASAVDGACLASLHGRAYTDAVWEIGFHHEHQR
jgi:hypothetical protein